MDAAVQNQSDGIQGELSVGFQAHEQQSSLAVLRHFRDQLTPQQGVCHILLNVWAVLGVLGFFCS